MKYAGTPKIAAALTCLLGAGLAAAAGALGTKIVDLDFLITRLDAVSITKVTVAGQQIQPGLGDAFDEETQPGKPFEADEDWLKNMSIFLTNRTDRVIVCAEIELWFPDTKQVPPMGSTTTYTITVGQPPEWFMYYRNGTKRPPNPAWKPLFLAPGRTVEIKVGDYIDEIQSLVEERLLFWKVAKVFISRHRVYFADGMRWDGIARGYYVPETGKPGHYTKLDDNFFPGPLVESRH